MKIMNWILDNKEWLFSGVGLVLFMFFYNRVIRFFNRGSTSPDINNNSPIPSFSISPKEVINQVSDGPLLQREGKAKSYIGLKVDWEGFLFTIHMRDEIHANVRLSSSKMSLTPFIDTEVKIDDYPQLKVLKEGHKIKVTGEIVKVGSSDITLRNTTLTI